MSDFVVITRQDFEKFLPKNFIIIDNPSSKEMIYDIPTDNLRLNIRIFSSVDIRSGDSRNLGEDAIRCVLVDTKSDKPVDKGKRTHRMTNWRERLQDKIDQLKGEINSFKFCKTCGCVMQLKKNKQNGNEFYGCIQYPACRTTMKDGKYFESKNTEESSKVVRCPLCDSLMKKREGYKGEFYGCTQYPTCKGTRQVQNVEVYGEGVDSSYTAAEERQDDSGAQMDLHDAEKDDAKRNEEEYVESVIETKKYNDVPSEDNDVELINTSEFPYLKFKYEKFNPVQSRVFKFYADDSNMIIAAATSAGKTTMAEMAMSHAICVNNKKALFLSPLKAVSQEKYDDWTDASHDWSKLNVSIVTGDYQLTAKRVEELNKSNVVILTSEMLDSRTRRIETEHNSWLLEAGVLVCDEAHLLCMKGRGDKLESALMRFTKQNPTCRIVLLSATMPNVSELAEWLTSLNGKKTELINSNYRPCKLEKHYVPYTDTGMYQQKESNKQNKVIEILQNFPKDKFIVFVHAKKMGHDIYDRLNNMGEKVEIHNADLSLAERRRVTEEFHKKEDGIRIIVATSTLAWGVNLPARQVIVTGIHRGMNEVEPLDIRQMIGRAGRVGFDPKGDAHILLPQSKLTRYKVWCEEIPPIKSTINDPDVLAFHVVAEMSSGEIYNIETLMDWYNRSLAAFQNSLLDRIDAETLLNKLEQINILEKTGSQFKVTRLGRIASDLYFSPYSIAGWFFNFKKLCQKNLCDNDTALSWALANIHENYENYIPKELADPVKRFIAECRNLELIKPDSSGETNCDGVGIIGYTYQCIFRNITGIGMGKQQKYMLQYDVERVITSLKRIDKEHAHWGRDDWWDKLQMRIKYEVGWDCVELCSLKGIGGVFAKELAGKGIKTIAQFKNNRNDALNVLGKVKYEKILNENNLL